MNTKVTPMDNNTNASTRNIPDRQHQVHGRRFAMEIRSSSQSNRVSLNPATAATTVSFDFAPKKTNSKGVLWDNKIIFQLTSEELFDLCSLMASIHISLNFDFHGPQNDKSLFVRWQTDGSILFTCNEGKANARKSYTVAVQNKFDRISVFNTCLYALAKNLGIQPNELMMQLATMNKKPALEEVERDQATRQHNQPPSTGRPRYMN